MSDRIPHRSSETGGPSEADWEAIARFLAGESDPVESANVRAWLAAHPEDAVLVDAVKAHSVHVERRADITVDTEVALMAVRARLSGEASVDATSDATAHLSVSRGGVPRTVAVRESAPRA